MAETEAATRTERSKPITRGVKAAIARHAGALNAADGIASLEAAFQAAIQELGRARLRLRPIHAALEERGLELCATHPRGDLVPRWGPGRRLTVCGESYRVGRGQNSAGVRWAWAGARSWAQALMEARGLSITASGIVWDWWSEYPHRALRAVEEFDAGHHRDPVMNALLRRKDGTHPIRCEIGDDRRAHRPCPCCDGGTLFDWGCGWSDRIIPLSWRCNRCPAEFVEYVSNARLVEIRNPDLAHGDVAR